MPSPIPPSRHPTLRAASLFVLLTMFGCGASTWTVHKLEPDKIKLDKRTRQDVRGTRATLEVPTSFKRAADRVWTLKQHDGLVFLLNVRRTRTPEQGAERWFKQKIAQVQRSGQAGITANDPVELGDLVGHYIEAIDLVGANRQVLYQVVVEVEDGLYIASLYAPISLRKSHGEALAATVKSLRVTR